MVWLLAVSIKSDNGQTDECFPSTLYYDITIWKPFEKVSTNKVSNTSNLLSNKFLCLVFFFFRCSAYSWTTIVVALFFILFFLRCSDKSPKTSSYCSFFFLLRLLLLAVNCPLTKTHFLSSHKLETLHIVRYSLVDETILGFVMMTPSGVELR